jgi:hypothetical protein
MQHSQTEKGVEQENENQRHINFIIKWLIDHLPIPIPN